MLKPVCRNGPIPAADVSNADAYLPPPVCTGTQTPTSAEFNELAQVLGITSQVRSPYLAFPCEPLPTDLFI